MEREQSMYERARRFAVMPARRVCRELGAGADGLAPEQVRQSRRLHGENRLADQRPEGNAARLRRAFGNPFSLTLLGLGCISLVTDVLLGARADRSGWAVAIIFGMLLAGGLVRFGQELRAARLAARLGSLAGETRADVLRDGVWRSLPADELVVGDTVRLKAGEQVPADLRLVRASGLTVTQAAITGESAALPRNPAPLAEPLEGVPAEWANLLFKGSAVVNGEGVGVVFQVGEHTLYGGLRRSGRSARSGFDRGANSIAWVLIRFMAVLTPAVFLASGLVQGSWGGALLFAVSVAVGLTPEMLPMVINACLARGSAVMEKKQTLVRDINAMQGFGSMDVLCVDKTGTLTDNAILLEYYMDILGNESERALDAACLNSLYHTGGRDQLDAAVLRCAGMPGRQEHFNELAAGWRKLGEVPFDHDRRCASVLVERQGRRMLITKGSVYEVYRRCRYVEYKGQITELTDHDTQGVDAVVAELLADGMKVLAVAEKPMDGAGRCTEADERDLTLIGYLAFFDAPKKSAAQALEKLRALHVKVKVLTGDQKAVAASVCRRLGLDAARIITGAELEALGEEEYNLRVEGAEIFAELTPRQKARVVHILQENGHTVGFLGDGMNDLPAVLQADVGISVDNGVDAVRNAAQVILLKKDLNVLEQGILEGRKAFVNMSKYIRITASSNFGNICAIVAASLFLPFLPMTAVQLLVLNLLYDLICLALPWDRVEPALYSRPREWSGRTLGRFMGFFGPVSSLFDLLTFAFLYWVLCPAVCGGAFAVLDAAGQLRFAALFQAGWFLESMWTQVLILYLLRTPKGALGQGRPSPAVVLVTGIGLAAVTAVVLSPLGGALGFGQLPPVYGLFLPGVAGLYLLLMGGAKRLFLRRWRELI